MAYHIFQLLVQQLSCWRWLFIADSKNVIELDAARLLPCRTDRLSRDIPGDAEQPGREPGFVTERAQILKGAHESLLGEFFGQRAIVDHANYETHDGPRVTLEDETEGLLVTTTRARDQVFATLHQRSSICAWRIRQPYYVHIAIWHSTARVSKQLQA